MRAYRGDLTYIHEAGFKYVLDAAPGLLRLLATSGVNDGLVVDLGCGSGTWARELNRAGYDVLGIDQSPEFIRMARATAPKSKFVRDSIYRAKLPTCNAVTALGEVLNYQFDGQGGALDRLLARVSRALPAGGVFIFDIATPERIPERSPRHQWFEGRDWGILVETIGDRKRNELTRQLHCFRKAGRLYRRSEETHHLKLYSTREILAMLKAAGFDGEPLSGYGGFKPPYGVTPFLAKRKLQRRPRQV